MTFTELSATLSTRCYDEAAGNADGKRFSAAQRLAALNSAVTMTVNAILSGSTDTRKVHDLLQELITFDTVTVNSGGFELSSLSSRLSSAGVKFVEALIGVNWVPAVERTVDELRLRRNRYLAGTNDAPMYHIADGRLYLDITVGSYPVQARIYYVRSPKVGVYSNPSGYKTVNLELSDNLAEAVLAASGALMFTSTDELERTKLFFEMFTAQVGAEITKSLAENEQVGGIRQ